MRAILLIAFFFASAAAQAQDVAAGERAFKVCGSCHKVGPGARATIGPPLNGLFGRKAGSVDGFSYSTAMKTSNIIWNDANFTGFMANPRAFVPGTSQGFAGLDDIQKIQDLAAFLKQFDASGKIGVAPADTANAKVDPATLQCLRSLSGTDHGQACKPGGGDLLQAVGALVGGRPSEGYGWFDGAALIGRGEAEGYRYVRRLRASSADPCRFEESLVAQVEGRALAELTESSYDFRGVTGVRYRLKDGDFIDGVPVKPEDPDIVQVTMDGSVLCREMIGIDPKSREKRECGSVMILNTRGPENVAVAIPAMEIVKTACGSGQ
jgi:cytochrome c